MDIIDDELYIQMDPPASLLMKNFTPLTEASLIRIVSGFSTRKSSGVSDIPTCVLLDREIPKNFL